jgi:S1-C subfamily serine protease
MARRLADDEALDAYSAAVASVAARASPSVLGIRSLRGDRGGAGSGFVFTPDGLVLTNSHVVAGARRVEVRSTDTDAVIAEVIGDDPHTDTALLRAALGIPALELGRSRELRVGQLAIAIGNPLGFDATVTAGVVSALGRSLRSSSGGPLMNARGQVIGMNTAIILGAQGICFAIGADTVHDVAIGLLRHGRIRRASLGIAVLTVAVSQQIRRHFDGRTQSAVRIADVQPRGAADTAGLRAGDLLMSIGGVRIAGVDDLWRFLTEERIGQALPIEVVRSGRRRVCTIMPCEQAA